jgi:lipopolysaccharide transport system ATP-binding protein
MAETVIRVESLSKQYRLGQIGGTTLREDIQRWWARVRGRADPTLKVTETNDRTQRGRGDYVWALKDVSFEVQRGEAFAIVGRNGAGKSTLLKILSRITAPTSGQILAKGRIASLLEVGTGFHGELTGRENIYLNGAVLGMSRAEITRKLDEIIEFSGCERFIDTPVKRYSSGMTVRLGFAVAAHLEPEILVVDEVLAVGDAEFQKRCLGKMKDVTGHGRTVLFVSHNMPAVESLCSRALLLDEGMTREVGPATDVIAHYLGASGDALEAVLGPPSTEGAPQVLAVRLAPQQGAANGCLSISDGFELVVDYWNPDAGTTLHVNLLLYAEDGYCVMNTYSDVGPRGRGRLRATCSVPANLLNARTYSARVLLVRDFSNAVCDLEGILTFTLREGERQIPWFGHWPGAVRPQLAWVTAPQPD